MGREFANRADYVETADGREGERERERERERGKCEVNTRKTEDPVLLHTTIYRRRRRVGSYFLAQTFLFTGPNTRELLRSEIFKSLKNSRLEGNGAINHKNTIQKKLLVLV
jgi:hypothetical protein